MLPKQLIPIKAMNNMKNIFQEDPTLVFEIKQGLERETLRVDDKGVASLKPHPNSLGSKLTHPSITTDYSENLMEFITPVFKSTNDLLNELTDIQSFTFSKLENEFFWPSSMPSILQEDNKIPLAYYGDSNVGKLKTLYRKGLGLRYGRSMQSIAGVHYNFSLSDRFWEYLKTLEKNELEFVDFRNKKYFHLIRNFQKYRWLLIYLFGSSPVVDESFLRDKKHSLVSYGKDTYGSEYGISLRMGGLGYTSKAQEQIGICFNQLETYLKTLEKARLTPFEDYEKIGLKKQGEYQQLNTNILQIDNEFYSTLRPKAVARTRESALLALHRRGIEYIEVRLLDVNPFSPTGIDKETINFLHLFLCWCLVKESPRLCETKCIEAEQNLESVVNNGRKPGQKVLKDGQKVTLVERAKQVLDEISEFSKEIQKVDNHYHLALDDQYRKLDSIDSLPSSKVLNALSGKSFVDFNQELINLHKKQFILPPEKRERFEIASAFSLDEEKRIKSLDQFPFEEFLANYFKDIKIKF